MKQQSRYDSLAPKYIKVGESATVYSINHPKLGNDLVHTTIVLSHDPDTGVFETKNTIYKPLG